MRALPRSVVFLLGVCPAAATGTEYSTGPVAASATASRFMDVMVTFRSVPISRGWWFAFLEQFPPDLGNLRILADVTYSRTAEHKAFVKCIKQTGVPVSFDILEEGSEPARKSGPSRKATGPNSEVETLSYAKNSWKFWLDEYENVAPVIAILDDDACLVDHFVPADVLDAHGKIIQHGIHVNGGAFVNWVSDIHLPFLAHFMTEFPVYIWRDMLPDLRAWMVKEGVNEEISSNATRAKAQFWRAYANLFNRGHGHKSEFNLIHNWAAADERWKNKYRYRIAPQKLSLGTSFHQHRMGCAGKEHLSQRHTTGGVERTWREHLLFYPNTVNYHFFDDEVLDPIRFRSFFLGANPKDSVWSKHYAKQNSAEWRAMLQIHDYAVAAYKSQGHALSYEEVIPDVVAKWAKCFNYSLRVS